MAKKKHVEAEPEAENAERWLLTYADMMTLLVAFFILMYSMSVANIKKFNVVAIAIRSGFGGDFGKRGVSIAEKGWPTAMKGEMSGGTPSQRQRKKLATKSLSRDESEEPLKLYEYVSAQLATLKLDKSFVPLLDMDSAEGNRVRVIMSDRIWFAKGETTLTEAGRKEILGIGRVISESTFKIAIDGYASAGSEQVGDGWAQSQERARQVSMVLANELKINPRRLMLSGYGEWKDPGETRKLKMTVNGGWEPVEGRVPDNNRRDVVIVSLIIK
ncbi:MAG: flagellar motor protein MotB [bacterium]